MSTYLYLIMHFILKFQKSLYPDFKAVWHLHFNQTDDQNTGHSALMYSSRLIIC